MIDSIELPNHLHFKVENGQIHCSSLPGFYLIDPLEWSQKLGIPHLLVLQNNLGQKKILLRTGEMEVINSEIKQSFDRVVYPKPDTPWNFRVYDVVQSADEKIRLHSYSPADMLELTYQLFLKKRYSQAANYFQHAHFVKGLDEVSDQMLKKIIEMDDLHPNAVVFKLRAALALARNEVFYGQKKWDSLHELTKEVQSLS